MLLAPETYAALGLIFLVLGHGNRLREAGAVRDGLGPIRRGDVQQLHLQAPVAVEAGALQAECGVQQVAYAELAGQLAVVEEHGFDWHAVEGAEAGPPVLALVAQLATLGQPQVPGREGGVLEAGAKRRQALERAREVVADRLGLQIAVDPQDWLQALDRQRLANDFLKALDQLVEALGWQAEAGRRLVAAIANENVVACRAPSRL